MKGSQIKSKIRRQNDIIKIEWKLIIKKEQHKSSLAHVTRVGSLKR